MHRFIGKKKPKTPPPTLDDTEKRITGRADGLDEKIAKLDKELVGYKQQLKKARGAKAAQLKKRAVQVLKRKKMLAQQAFNIEQTNFTINSLKDTQTTVETMKASAKTLKQEFKKLNIDKVEDLQDDLADLMEDSEEINEIMSRSYGLPDDVDEEDLDAELEALGSDLEDFELDGEGEEAVPDYLKPSSLPSAPNASVEGSDAQDEYGLPSAPEAVAT